MIFCTCQAPETRQLGGPKLVPLSQIYMIILRSTHVSGGTKPTRQSLRDLEQSAATCTWCCYRPYAHVCYGHV